MNNDLAIACKKDSKHAASIACIYYSENGDGFDVTLVLCCDGFKFISQKQNSGFLFTVYDSLEAVFLFGLCYPDVAVCYSRCGHVRYQWMYSGMPREKKRKLKREK